MNDLTREEAIEVLDDMKVKIDIPKSAVTQHKRNEALDMAISAISTEGEYIKKEHILNELGDTNMDILTDEVKEIVNSLPSYSFPDSADIEKIQTEILEKMADYVAGGYADSAEDFEEYSRIVIQTFNEHIGGASK